jgi:hypothetical protein
MSQLSFAYRINSAYLHKLLFSSTTEAKKKMVWIVAVDAMCLIKFEFRFKIEAMMKWGWYLFLNRKFLRKSALKSSWKRFPDALRASLLAFSCFNRCMFLLLIFIVLILWKSKKFHDDLTIAFLTYFSGFFRWLWAFWDFPLWTIGNSLLLVWNYFECSRLISFLNCTLVPRSFISFRFHDSHWIIRRTLPPQRAASSSISLTDLSFVPSNIESDFFS